MRAAFYLLHTENAYARIEVRGGDDDEFKNDSSMLMYDDEFYEYGACFSYAYRNI